MCVPSRHPDLWTSPKPPRFGDTRLLFVGCRFGDVAQLTERLDDVVEKTETHNLPSPPVISWPLTKPHLAECGLQTSDKVANYETITTCQKESATMRKRTACPAPPHSNPRVAPNCTALPVEVMVQRKARQSIAPRTRKTQSSHEPITESGTPRTTKRCGLRISITTIFAAPKEEKNSMT